MKQLLVSFVIGMICFSCTESTTISDVQVSNISELNQAIKDAGPGDEIVMANGNWKDVQIRFVGQGTEDNPITLRAETPGKVVIHGESDLKLAGEYLVVDGLFFTKGFSPSRAVMEFAINEDSLANHSRITNCVIKDFNKAQRNLSDIWIQLKGRHNQVDHCYVAGKSNRGPTVRVDLKGNQSIKNYHKIINNHFGPRPPKGGPSAENHSIRK